MIEFKDIVQSGIALAGWALAVYQYVRNERQKLPLVVVQSTGFKRGDTQCGGTVIARNRGPWDVHVETMRVISPAGAMMVIPGAGGRRADGSIGPHSMGRDRLRRLDFRLPAYAAGEFPSKSRWFAIEFPEPAGPSFACVDLEFAIELSRCTWSSKRLTIRKSIQMTNR